MNWLHEFSNDKIMQKKLYNFLIKYGFSGLDEAMQNYSDMQQEYIYSTRTNALKIKIQDIYYLKIHGHAIIACTEQGIFQKYGSLNNELKTLSNYGFVKCNQSCIVSLAKIKSICNSDIILTNNEIVHMSRKYAPKIITAFHNSVRR